MAASIVNWDSAQRIAQLELDSAETVFLGGSYLDQSLFGCNATVKNIFGLPIKRIWRFAFVAGKSDRNLVHLDFEEHPPFYALVGYAMQFSTIAEMRSAQGSHALLFDAERAFNILMACGAISRKE
jgi:hypothetical protein